MIASIDLFIKSRFFSYLRFLQFFAAIVIFTFAALMPQKYLAGVHATDSSLHFLGNVLLFLSASLALYKKLRFTTLVVLLLPYSVAIELAQWLTPARQVDPKDIFNNIAGLVTGLLIVYCLTNTWIRLSEKHLGKL